MLKLITPEDLGVNVHSNSNAYKSRIPALAAKANELGVGWLRDNNPAGAKLWKDAGFRGKVLITVQKDWDAETAVVNLADAIDPVNEITMNTDTTKPPTLAARKLDVSAIVTKVAGRVPVIATSIASISQAKADALGYQPHAQRANLHCYRGNQDEAIWRQRQADWTRYAGTACPGKANWTTENGYHQYLVPGKTATYKGVENNNHAYTSEDDAAKQILGDVQSFFNLGADKVFLYEFIDEGAYMTVDGDADHEGYFGLLKEDMSWKKHAIVLRDWIKTLVPTPTPVPGPAPAAPDCSAIQVQLDAANAKAANLNDQLVTMTASLNSANVAVASQQAAMQQADSHLTEASMLLQPPLI